VDLKVDRVQIQSQRLSPSMLRSLNVLQLPAEELFRLVAAEIQRNPLLDIADAAPCTFPASWNGERTINIDARARARNISNAEEDNLNFLENISAEDSPEDYLLAQVPDLEEVTKTALKTLINSLDDRGFLPEDAARQFGISMPNGDESFDLFPRDAHQNAFEKAYAVLRSLSPRGIGARDLQDCLRLQIPENTPLHGLVVHHFDDLEHRRFAKLRRKIGKTATELRTLLAPLKLLNFAPLKAITPHTDPVVVPEVVFRKVDGHWTCEIRGTPEIHVSDLYQKLATQPLKREDRVFVTTNQKRAQFWVKMLRQRRGTLRKIAEYILKFQSDFLENGSNFLHPQSQKQAAAFLEIHPATLSRAIKNKYAQIPHRIVPLDFFFSHGNHGSLIAQNALRENIKNIIRDEDKNMPLSDEKIAKMLQNEGIWITRRTVAKYRALFAIPSANVRRYM
jgi:RNA polymerase sigma-54 factor